MPNFTRSDYLTFTQQYSIYLDGAFADFFRAESLLSELTLAETQGTTPAVSLDDVWQAFQASSKNVSKLMRLIEAEEELLKTVIDYYDFYIEQKQQLELLLASLTILSMSIPMLEMAAQNNRLQASLQHDEENAGVRKAGISASRTIAKLLLSYSEQVEETN